MRVLHLISFYVPAYRTGGPIFSVHNLNKWLVKRGVSVTVYATNIDGNGTLDVPLNRPVDVDGVEVNYFKYSPPRIWEYAPKMHEAIKKNISNFDLVHITSMFRAPSLLGGYFARYAEKPYIISPRGSLMKEPLHRKSRFIKEVYLALVERNNLRKASAVHFTSDAEKDEYIETGLPLKKAILIPNAYEPENVSEPHKGYFREKFSIPKDKKVVLFLSRLNWKKGLDTLVPAMALVLKEEPDAILIMAGADDEGYKRKVQQMIFKAGIENKVIFTDVVLGKDKVAAFRESDVFALPSYSENFGMAVVEAMYYGLPVVISKYVGIGNRIAEARAGLVVEKNEKDVAKAIIKILKDKKLGETLSNRAQKLTEQFSPPKIAESFLEEYNLLIHNAA